MDLFIDSADIKEIEKASQWGIIDGVTTNPTLMASQGEKVSSVIEQITRLVDGPVSAEVIATDAEGMIREGKEFAAIHPNVTIKLPMTEEGIKALHWFSDQKIKTNITLIFSPLQALIAAKGGATFVSPFLGRLDDIGQPSVELIKEIKTIFEHYKMPTKILAASIRGPQHLRESALTGAHVATCPYKVLKQAFQHPLTDKGLNIFLKDAKNLTL